MLAVEFRFGLTEGALTIVAGVFGGAVVKLEVAVDLIVVKGEDIIGAEQLVNVTEGIEAFVPVGSGVDFVLMLVKGSGAGLESEVNVTEWVVKVDDLVKVVMIVLGLEME